MKILTRFIPTHHRDRTGLRSVYWFVFRWERDRLLYSLNAKRLICALIIFTVFFFQITGEVFRRPTHAKGRKLNETVYLLIEKLRSPKVNVRLSAAEDLRKMGGAAKVAVSALIVTLNDPDKDVRVGAAYALGQIGREAKELIPVLVKKLKSATDTRTKLGVAQALGLIGEEANNAVPVLLEILVQEKQTDEDVRVAAAHALRGILNSDSMRMYGGGSGGGKRPNYVEQGIILARRLGIIDEHETAPIAVLINILRKNADLWMRLKAIEALKLIAMDDDKVVPELIKVLKTDPNPEIKRDVAYALASLEHRAKDAVPILIEILKTNENADVRKAAAYALGLINQYGLTDESVIAALDNALNDENADVQFSAIQALGNLHTPVVIPILIKALKTQPNETNRAHAAVRLKDIIGGAEDIELTQAFIDALRDTNEYVRGRAIEALGSRVVHATRIVPAFTEVLKTSKDSDLARIEAALTQIANSLAKKEDVSLIEPLEDAYDELTRSSYTVASDLKLSIENLKRIKREKELPPNTKTTDYPYIVGAIAVLLFLLITWLTIYLLSPLWLLKIYEIFPLPTETRITGAGISIGIPLQTLISIFIFRPRVLDAWVRKHGNRVMQRFTEKQTVKERRIYVPVGLFLDKELVAKVEPERVQEIFNQNQVRLLISGEGGAGKTSLACQFAKWSMTDRRTQRLHAKHLMLPVLLEQDFVENDKDVFVKTIGAQLGDLVDSTEPISTALLRQLLKKKRILVIVDGMSEMNDATRQNILIGVSEVPTNAVIFTSRRDEDLAGLNKTIITPTKIKGNQLSSFVEGYLSGLGKKELFEDEEFFEGCRRLSVIVGDRHITALLARLFIEQMIAQKESVVGDELPKNIPELMLQSIKLLHVKTPADGLGLRDVIKAAKLVAWECLKKDFRPLPASTEAVKATLTKIDNGEKLLDYLEKRLLLIDKISFDEKIRFKIDPLSEYLAGLSVIETNTYREDMWQKFLDEAEKKESSVETIKGFLLALRDCCLMEGNKEMVPEYVISKLSQLIVTGTPAEGQA